MKHIQHKGLKLQEYLVPNVTNIKLAKFTYHARNRILDVKANYKNKHDDLLCPVCCLPGTVDSQEHLLPCVKLGDTMLVQDKDDTAYDNLFSLDVKKQVTIATIMQNQFAKRKSIIK